MSAFTDPWHFARPELAQAYLQGFDIGLTSARWLFALRRMGESEFLKHDLLPAAARDGYSYMLANNPSIFVKASLTIWRIDRNG